MDSLSSICLNEEQVILFHLQLLSESRAVCTALKMKKPTTQRLLFFKLDVEYKEQTID